MQLTGKFSTSIYHQCALYCSIGNKSATFPDPDITYTQWWANPKSQSHPKISNL